MKELLLQRLQKSIPNIPVHLLSNKELADKFGFTYSELATQPITPDLVNLFNYEEIAPLVSTNNDTISSDIIDEKPQSTDSNEEDAKKTSRDELEERILKENKILDFGEKIGGARKDYYSSYSHDLTNVLSGSSFELVNKQSLKEILPEPNYSNLLEDYGRELSPELLSVMKLNYLKIGKKPSNRSYTSKIERWANQVKECAFLFQDIFDNLDNGDYLDSLLERERNKLLLPASLHNTQQQILYGILVETEFYKHKKYNFKFINEFKSYGNPPSYLRVYNHRIKYDRVFDNPKEAVMDIVSQFNSILTQREEVKREEKSNSYKIYFNRYENAYYVGIDKRIGGTKQIIRLSESFDDKNEAFAYLKNPDNKTFLDERYFEEINIPFERNEVNVDRTGKIYRDTNISPEDYKETFGFRGVEFGNYLNNKERQEVLNRSYDAFLDLASVLQLPPKGLSLNGTLAMAFGARGRGGKNAAMAHYEPNRMVINLTKNRGAGSLAHEWWHAIDNYFGTKSTVTKYSTQIYDTSLIDPELSNRKILYDKLSNFKEFIKKETKLKTRSSRLDDFSSKKQLYWSTDIEMSARSFEAYVKSKLKAEDIQNDFLVNIRSESGYIGKQIEKYPYPLESEQQAVNNYFDEIFDTIENEVLGNNVHLYQVKNNKLLGHFANNQIFINSDEFDESTPIHEFSHYWINSLKVLNPSLYSKGIELIQNEGAAYVDSISKEPFYSNLSNEQILEEALATAIGDRGAQILNDNRAKSKFAGWMNGFKNFLSNTFFYKQKDKIDTLSLDSFLDASVYDLLQGEDLKITEELKNTENKTEATNTSEDDKLDDLKYDLFNSFPLIIQAGVYDSSPNSDHHIDFQTLNFDSLVEMREFLLMRSSSYNIEKDQSFAVRIKEGEQIYLLDDGAVVSFNDFIKDVVKDITPKFLEHNIELIQSEFNQVIGSDKEVMELIPNDRIGDQAHLKVSYKELELLFAKNIAYTAIYKVEGVSEWQRVTKGNLLPENNKHKLENTFFELNLKYRKKGVILELVQFLEDINNEFNMENNINSTRNEEIMKLIPEERRGENFHIKVSKNEAEYLLRNNIVSDIMNAEYGSDEEWVGMTSDDFDEESRIFDEEYQTFEIDLIGYTDTNIISLLSEIEKIKEVDQNIVGKLTFHDSGEIMEYKSTEDYLKALNIEVDFNIGGFSYETITKEPDVRKKVDDIIYGAYGEENPNSIEFYTNSKESANEIQGEKIGGNIKDIAAEAIRNPDSLKQYDQNTQNVINSYTNQKSNIMENTDNKKEKEPLKVGRLSSTEIDGKYFKGNITSIEDGNVTLTNRDTKETVTTRADKIYQFHFGQKYGIQEILNLFKDKPGGFELKDISKEDISKLLRGKITDTVYDGVNREGNPFSTKFMIEEKAGIPFLKPYFKIDKAVDLESMVIFNSHFKENEIKDLLDGKDVILERTSQKGNDYLFKVTLDTEINQVIPLGFVNAKEKTQQVTETQENAAAPKKPKREFENQYQYEEFLRNDVNMFENAQKINLFQLDKMILTLDQGELNEFLTDLEIEGNLIDNVLQMPGILTNDTEVTEIKSEILQTVNSSSEKVDLFKEKFQSSSETQNKGLSR